MRSYLSLVSQYAKVHRKKNRLTVICIAISVMLVTAIFGMADLSLKSQQDETIRRYGNWHVIISNLPDHLANLIGERKDISVSGYLGMAQDIVYHDKELTIQSSNQELARQMNLIVNQGHYPVKADEALLDQQAMEQFELTVGDSIELDFGSGQRRIYLITGTYQDYSSLKGSDSHGLQLSPEGLEQLPENMYQKYFYIKFKKAININQALSDIKIKYSLTDDQISTNVMLLGLMGQSKDDSMLQVYLTAGILFVLVTMAGTFMIASSFNMSILERTQFFGLLRCLGATKKQIKRYITLEGIRYCRKAIPFGIIGGSMILWLAIAVLNILNSAYLPVISMFQVSFVGIIGGTVVGFLVVMLASAAPARQAAKVSPQNAVIGNVNQMNNHKIGKASNTKIFHVDVAMGLSHAFSNRRSLILIAGSFAISIILFLCFTILITFMNQALSPLKAYAPDLSIEGINNEYLLDQSLLKQIKNVPDVKEVYGRMFYTNIPAEYKQTTNKATLVSYDEKQFLWTQKSMISGDIDEVRDGNGVLVDHGYMEQSDWQIGDEIIINISGINKAVRIEGILSDVPIDSPNGEWIIICSEQMFEYLTGISKYKVIDIQVIQDNAELIRALLSPEMKLLDLQQHNAEVRTGYFAMAVFVYGFLLVIAFVALINIINTINSSVSSRMKNYGVMRAVGMSARQLKKVIITESATYAITGSIVGGGLGLLFHRYFYQLLITANWGQRWQPPFIFLVVTICVALLTAFIAVILPTKKIKNMSIVNVVNAD